MGLSVRIRRMVCVTAMLACAFAVLFACACTAQESTQASAAAKAADDKLDTSRFVVAVEDEPDTVDFQCTSIHYTVAINAFDRLVETELNEAGEAYIAPSLAKSWEVSDDGCTYTFHLRDDVRFSNGSALTSEDVRYTFHRLLTHPDSCNGYIVASVEGASELQEGKAEDLAGFKVIDDLTFSLTLKEPYEAFLACLSMPGVSILDKQTTEEAGDRFGIDPAATVGTGPYVLKTWTPQENMILVANKGCWSGAPNNEGLDLRFMTEPVEVRSLFEDGGIDVLDLDEVGSAAEFFIHGDIYRERLFMTRRIGIHYVALNESVAPLEDVRVRKALQLALNRTTLLYAVYDGNGDVENGIYPHGLHGFNADLPQIPYDPEQARQLLSEAGYTNGIDITISVGSSSTVHEMTLVRLIASMWEEVGVRVHVQVLDNDDFMRQRKAGELECYSALWTADYDDPDNFVYTFFGSEQNTTFRSLCYGREDVMERVRAARTIANPSARLHEYQELERIIAQDDAAWVPLFSRQRIYVTSERAHGIEAAWNGSVKTKYRTIVIDKTAEQEER